MSHGTTIGVTSLGMSTVLEFFRIGPQHLNEMADMVNSAYRGESSRAGWTTETDLLDGGRTDVEALSVELDTPGRCLFGVRSSESPILLGCVSLHQYQAPPSTQTPGVADCFTYLGMLTVRPNSQGTGIGKFVLQQVEHFARSQGSIRVSLGVVHLRESLIAWYERHGFVRTGKTEPFPPANPRFGIPKVEGLYFVLMEKKIGP